MADRGDASDLEVQAAVMPMYGKYCSDYVDMIDRIVAEGR